MIPFPSRYPNIPSSPSHRLALALRPHTTNPVSQPYHLRTHTSTPPPVWVILALYRQRRSLRAWHTGRGAAAALSCSRIRIVEVLVRCIRVPCRRRHIFFLKKRVRFDIPGAAGAHAHVDDYIDREGADSTQPAHLFVNLPLSHDNT